MVQHNLKNDTSKKSVALLYANITYKTSELPWGKSEKTHAGEQMPSVDCHVPGFS